MLDNRRLVVLQRFAVLGSITAVATDLDYSPSAISQQLSALEREAGIALIERTAHTASLTDAGRELVHHAGSILSAVEEAEGRMRARAGVIGGRVILSCIPGLAVSLAPHLAQLQRRHPDLSIVAHETSSIDAATALLERRSDLAIVDDWTQNPRPRTSGLEEHQLHREQIVLALPDGHRLLGPRNGVTDRALRELVGSETWLCAPVGELSRSAGDDRLAAIAARPRRRWQFEGLHVLASLVAADAGVALLPSRVAETQPGVTTRPLKPRMYRQVMALTRSSVRQDPAVRACLGAAQQAFAPSRIGPV